jgi:predicted negative regulator of RcsB-dependent stress response
MARQRFRRKDLKRPDEFVTRGRAFIQWASGNVQTLSWAAGGFAVAVLAVAGFFSQRTARVRQANEDLAQALTGFQAARYAEAASQLAGVADRWQSTPIGHIAALYAGEAEAKANNVDAASTRLRDVVAAGQPPPYLRQQALVALGSVLERKGDVAAAAEQYAQAASAEGPYTATALLGEARCRDQAGEKDKARTLYERFAQEFSQAPEIEVVQAKITALKG